MESARIGGGRLLDCPIEEYLDEDGDRTYRVLLADGTQIGYTLRPPMPLEEAQATIRELLFTDIRNGIFRHYDMRWTMAPEPHYEDGAQQEEPGLYMHHGFSAVPASDKAIADLQETAVGEGVCSVCLEALEADGATKLRMMPCSHSFHDHEDCIFTWLRVSHACPLGRFAMPTK